MEQGLLRIDHQEGKRCGDQGRGGLGKRHVDGHMGEDWKYFVSHIWIWDPPENTHTRSFNNQCDKIIYTVNINQSLLSATPVLAQWAHERYGHSGSNGSSEWALQHGFPLTKDELAATAAKCPISQQWKLTLQYGPILLEGILDTYGYVDCSYPFLSVGPQPVPLSKFREGLILLSKIIYIITSNKEHSLLEIRWGCGHMTMGSTGPMSYCTSQKLSAWQNDGKASVGIAEVAV